MNGRIYDPLLGRFLSADVMIPNSFLLQSYNRYSYVLNNPLRFTDPSGFQEFDPALASVAQARLELALMRNVPWSEILKDPELRQAFADRKNVTISVSDKSSDQRFMEVVPNVGLERAVGLLDVGPATDIAAPIIRRMGNNAGRSAAREGAEIVSKKGAEEAAQKIATEAGERAAPSATPVAGRVSNGAISTTVERGVPAATNVARDSFGRISEVTATIGRENLGGGTAATDAARTFAQQFGKDMDAGHLLARVLGGKGGLTSDNILPILSNINRGALSTFERGIASLVREGGAVEVKIALNYLPRQAGTASSLTYTVVRNGETVMEEVFPLMRTAN
jgi:hypothetical protein